LRALGVEQPEQFTDLTGYPLGAIVWLAAARRRLSRRRPDYHQSPLRNVTLQCNSTAECNRLEQGFLHATKKKNCPAKSEEGLAHP
jgi:hypothetical protein